MRSSADQPAGRGVVDQLPVACPACGAGVRGDVTWCLRCYANLCPDPPPGLRPSDRVTSGAPRVTPDPVAGAADPAVDPGVEPGRQPAGPEQVDVLADRMLAELAAAGTARPGWLDRAPRTPGAVILYGVVGLAAVSVLLLTLGAVVGQVVGSR
jgi:hypothetical protein